VIRRIATGAAALLLAGCASVTTQVTLLDPSVARAPAQDVEILLEPATRPHVTIALIESRGIVGETEGELLEAARQEAARVGADAVVKLSVTRTVRPPLEIYDPVFSPFYSRYALRAGTQWYPPYLGHYRRVGGGEALTLTALAIKYDADAARRK
jgi:hypothetical protein